MKLFQPVHYLAFEQPKPNYDDPPTRRERENVRQVLLELDDMLWPFINNSGWDLHRHRQEIHYVSSHHFVFLPDGTPVVNYINGMWLHYGKSPQQLDFLKTLGDYDHRRVNVDEYFNAFYLHTRIQFYINANLFRCWLLLATDKNYYDRSEYLRRINLHIDEQQKLYDLVLPLLGKGFFYEIDCFKLELTQGITKDELIRFVKKDKAGFYSGIVKEYQPNDPVLDVNKIEIEMIENLKLLYPIYDFMAWRPPII